MRSKAFSWVFLTVIRPVETKLHMMITGEKEGFAVDNFNTPLFVDRTGIQWSPPYISKIYQDAVEDNSDVRPPVAGHRQISKAFFENFLPSFIASQNSHLEKLTPDDVLADHTRATSLRYYGRNSDSIFASLGMQDQLFLGELWLCLLGISPVRMEWGSEVIAAICRVLVPTPHWATLKQPHVLLSLYLAARVRASSMVQKLYLSGIDTSNRAAVWERLRSCSESLPFFYKSNGKVIGYISRVMPTEQTASRSYVIPLPRLLSAMRSYGR